jgi:hypothetical protein
MSPIYLRANLLQIKLETKEMLRSKGSCRLPYILLKLLDSGLKKDLRIKIIKVNLYETDLKWLRIIQDRAVWF